MKKFFLIFALLFITSLSFAAVPTYVRYQGLLADTSGNARDTTVQMNFKIYDQLTGGLLKWSQLIATVNVNDGLFNVELGPIPDSVFNSTARFLGVTVGSNSEMTPREAVRSVPFAYRVGTVEAASGGTILGDVNIQGKANIGFGNTNVPPGTFVAGDSNTASGNGAAIGGGFRNTASGAFFPTVGGGDQNTASGYEATVGGGRSNSASNTNATVAGGLGNVASGSSSFVGSGYSNLVTSSNGVITGGDRSAVVGAFGFVGGGQFNSAADSFATATGGGSNSATGMGATVGGGTFGIASGDYSMVGGGGGVNSTYGNTASGDKSAIGGGTQNTASGASSTIAGGINNSATQTAASIGGGGSNVASGVTATIAGGLGQTADGAYSFIGGGDGNKARGAYSVVGGGGGSSSADTNSARGFDSVIPGGTRNETTGRLSFAAGYRAKALHDGAFVWADSTASDFASTAQDQFNVRASGGINMWTNSTATVGVTLTASDNTWNSICDSTLKTREQRVDGKEMLDKLATLPVYRWHHKNGDPNLHHIGPMAQDFWNAFHVGGDSLKISTIDPSGVALAAIQELTKQNCKFQEEIFELRTAVQTLQANMKQSDLK